MKSLLILPHIKVENANAISGLVYGFPAVTHFLGYVHALSRELKLDPRLGVKLGGCGIICHDYQVQAYKGGGGGEYVFSLTRNPLTKEGDTAPFNEEGKMRMEVSLVIECDFTSDDFDFGTGDNNENAQKFTELVSQLAVIRRLAGGYITSMLPARFYEIPQIEEEAEFLFRRILRRLLPGFVLCDRSNIFKQYLSANPGLSPLEGMLNLYTLKVKAISTSGAGATEGGKIKWEQISKPLGGWLVPIQSGYKSISPLYESGKVANARDSSVPFCFVEPIYGLAEWMGLHRIRNIEAMIWRYQHDKDFYTCSNAINNKI
jgi:CRISPR-associated protein Csy2